MKSAHRRPRHDSSPHPPVVDVDRPFHQLRIAGEIAILREQALNLSKPLPAIRRIADERLNRSLARNAVERGDGRDIVDSVDRDALVFRDSIGQ